MQSLSGLHLKLLTVKLAGLKMRKITLLDIIISILFFSTLFFAIIFHFFNKTQSSTLLVQTDQDDYYYSINQEKIIEIEGENGITKIEISHGKFRFLDSPCSEKICVNHGWISLAEYSIICLPNKVSAYIPGEKEKDNEFDGISR